MNNKKIKIILIIILNIFTSSIVRAKRVHYTLTVKLNGYVNLDNFAKIESAILNLPNNKHFILDLYSFERTDIFEVKYYKSNQRPDYFKDHIFSSGKTESIDSSSLEEECKYIKLNNFTIYNYIKILKSINELDNGIMDASSYLQTNKEKSNTNFRKRNPFKMLIYINSKNIITKQPHILCPGYITILTKKNEDDISLCKMWQGSGQEVGYLLKWKMDEIIKNGQFIVQLLDSSENRIILEESCNGRSTPNKNFINCLSEDYIYGYYLTIRNLETKVPNCYDDYFHIKVICICGTNKVNIESNISPIFRFGQCPDADDAKNCNCNE